MKREFTLIFVLLISFFSVAAEQSNNRQDSPEEVGRKYVNLNTDDPQADSLVQSIMSNSGSVVSMACCYESVDQNGRAVTLSGKIYFPKTELSKRIVVQIGRAHV